MAEDIEIKVINELDTQEYVIHAGQGETIGNLITRIYNTKLKRERKSDDRLYCRDSKDSVFQHEALTLKEYLELDVCKDLVWMFAGGTGGA